MKVIDKVVYIDVVRQYIEKDMMFNLMLDRFRVNNVIQAWYNTILLKDQIQCKLIVFGQEVLSIDL